jgi:hypothetical protein
MARMGDFIEEVTKAGVLLATDGLHPSSKGARVRLEDGDLTVTDGPFAESKELIASYAIFDVQSMDEAVEWTTKFLNVLGKGECEIRQIFDPSDFSDEVFPPREQQREAAVRERMAENAAR